MNRLHKVGLRISGIVCTVLILGSRLPAAGAWPVAGEDLPPDPAVTWGTLENGVRYAVLPHPEPPDRISLRLHVHAGALMEQDPEQGLAHYLEHMAFNGTEHFAAAEMVKYFQRLGMAFGADTNAYTGFDRTVYQLELPEGREELIDDGLLLLRDYAGRMNLAPEQIESERGVILSEMRERDTASFRLFQERLRFVLPDALFHRRMPIGVEETVRAVRREEFAAFYTHWYRPSRITVVAVGNVDPTTMAAQIERHFADMPEPERPAPDPALGTVAPDSVQAQYVVEAEAPAVTVALETVHPYTLGPDSLDLRIHQFRRHVAHEIISRRLDILAEAEHTVFSAGQAYAYDWQGFVTRAALDLTCRPADWQAALAVAEQELRRALEHGFTQAELREQVARILQSYEQDAERAATRSSRQIAEGLVRGISDPSVFTSPDQDLAIARQALEDLTPEDAWQALKDTWLATDSRYLFVGGNLEAVETPPRDLILPLYEASLRVAVTPPAETEDAAFAYDDFGAPGTIAEETLVEDLGITQLRFANGVRVNLKPTDFEANTIHVALGVGAGLLELPKERPGLNVLAEAAFIRGGLRQHSYQEIQRLFADKSVGMAFSVQDSAFVLQGSTTPADFLDQLRLLTAYLTEPGYREEALRQAHRAFEEGYRGRRHDPYGVYGEKVERYLAGGDPRFGIPPEEVLAALTLDDLRDWLREPLQQGALEVSIVGDFDPQAVIPALRQTLGALPERRAQAHYAEEATIIGFPPQEAHKEFSFDSQQPEVLVMVFWPTTDMSDIQVTRRIGLLTSVMRDRVRSEIREEMGESYSPTAFPRSSETFRDYGYITAHVRTHPDHAEETARRLRAIGSTLRQEELEDDAVLRARQPTLASLRQQVRSNAYWLRTVLMGSTRRPEKLDWARTIQSDYAAITREELEAIAERFLDPERSFTIFIRARVEE